MPEVTEDFLTQLQADHARLDKLARLVILRKGLILLFEDQEYCIDWLDTQHVQYGVAHQHFRNAIDKLSENPLLSLCAISEEIQ